MLLAASAQGLTHATHQQAQTPLSTHTASQILTPEAKKYYPGLWQLRNYVYIALSPLLQGQWTPAKRWGRQLGQAQLKIAAARTRSLKAHPEVLQQKTPARQNQAHAQLLKGMGLQL